MQVITEGDGRVQVETTKGHCIFTLEGAERQDEGIYSVVVRNPAGEDTADINVKVVGKNKHQRVRSPKLSKHNQVMIGLLANYICIKDVKKKEKDFPPHQMFQILPKLPAFSAWEKTPV